LFKFQNREKARLDTPDDPQQQGAAMLPKEHVVPNRRVPAAIQS
jgi:hypothetical protein